MRCLYILSDYGLPIFAEFSSSISGDHFFFEDLFFLDFFETLGDTDLEFDPTTQIEI
jgi:hypothetical protein